MCSGCAGDYEGNFEREHPAEPAHPADDGYPAAYPGGGFNEAASEFDANGAGGFEAGEHWELNPQSRSLRRGSDDCASERCEIRVSATRIIEVRVIMAEAGKNGQSPEEQGIGPPTRNHSRRESAKYYRTRGPAASVSLGDCARMLSLSRMAVLAGRELTTWARRARRALRW